jgi:hypothetical protein
MVVMSPKIARLITRVVKLDFEDFVLGFLPKRPKALMQPLPLAIKYIIEKGGDSSPNLNHGVFCEFQLPMVHLCTIFIP